MPEAFVLQTLRTARTKASPRGGFAGVWPVDLLVSLQRELVSRNGMDPGRVEDVIIGCASQNAEQGANIARTATMLAGWGDVPGVSINRFCASGIDGCRCSPTAGRCSAIRRRSGRWVRCSWGCCGRRLSLETLAALEPAFAVQGAEGQDALVLIGSRDAAKRLGVAVLVERVAA